MQYVCRARLLATLCWAAALILFVLACTLALAGPAHADGDPASDVLIGQDLFPGYGTLSPKITDELYSVTSAAEHAGYPVRIALIDSKQDLGAVPQEFGHPEKYAYFLDYEINPVVGGHILVVMPHGFGLASGGRPQSIASLSGIPIGPGTSGLGAAAVAATEKLAAAAGHPLGSGAASASVPLGASGASIDRALETLLVLGALAALAISTAVAARRRHTPARPADARH